MLAVLAASVLIVENMTQRADDVTVMIQSQKAMVLWYTGWGVGMVQYCQSLEAHRFFESKAQQHKFCFYRKSRGLFDSLAFFLFR